MIFIDDTQVLSILHISSKSNQEIFRRAFIHSALILFVILCGACAWLVYYILEPFFSSILWSILAGAFLFPLKTRCTSLVQCYLHQLDRDSHLLVFGFIIIFPLKFFDRTIEFIGLLCIRKWKELIGIMIFLPSIEFLQSGVVYRCLITVVYDYYLFFQRYIHLFDSLWMLLVIFIYFLAVLIVYNRSFQLKYILNILSIPIWFCLFIYLSQVFSIYYRLIVITLTTILAVVGYIIELNVNKSDRLTVFQHIRSYFHKKSALPTVPSSSSTRYFTFVFWSLIAIKVYDFSWYLIPISIFIVIYKIVKCLLFYLYTYFNSQTCFQRIIQRIIYFWTIRRDVFIPTPLHLIIRFIKKGDKKINHALQNSIDYLVSACLIVILLILIVFGTLFLLIQIQHESIQMIKLTTNFVNQTVIFQAILPKKENISHYMDTVFDKFYIFGKNWITAQVAKVQPPRIEPQCCLPLSVHPSESPYMHIKTFGQGSLSNKNLEEQALQLWESLYTYLTSTSTNRSRIFHSISNQSLFSTNPLMYLQTNFDFHLHDFYRLIHDNLDLLRTIFDSIWSNMTIVLTVFSTIISLIFTSGFALFNFIVSFIIFITLLFYLLSHSDQPIYRPTQWLNNLLAMGDSSLGHAVHDAITSVFIASLKIAVFYGLYTYVLHTLLGSNLVFLPVVIASICAVTLKSYWAALPGCLDLWLVQQRPLSALVLLLAQIIPVYIVDADIYSEVKGGGHQYLTALAIAGGVYYQGIEGALIGPMILCCLLVGIQMYNETIANPALSNPAQSLLITKNRT